MDTAEETIKKFVQRLLSEQGVSELGLEGEVQSQLETDLVDRVHDRINAAILAALPSEKAPNFEKVLDTGSEADIQQFCKEALPDLDNLVARELLAFRRTYLGLA